METSPLDVAPPTVDPVALTSALQKAFASPSYRPPTLPAGRKGPQRQRGPHRRRAAVLGGRRGHAAAARDADPSSSATPEPPFEGLDVNWIDLFAQAQAQLGLDEAALLAARDEAFTLISNL